MPNFVALLERRPSVGILASAGGNVLAWILSHLGQVTTILGFFSALFGLGVAYLTFRVQLRRWQSIRKFYNQNPKE